MGDDEGGQRDGGGIINRRCIDITFLMQKRMFCASAA